ncbi:MAG: SDR family oxidoreductase, partial [Firmicutes bacterium]|nr:SDR family oxidoreductase [Bacillota bacterium]
MRGLEGKIIVISGAAKGIGKATAKRFIEEGAGGIAILDFDYDEALKTVEELDPSDSVIQVLKCDVSKPDEVEIAVAAVMDRFGRIDVLINNAGITRDVMFHKMTDEQWHTVLDVNLNGAYYLSRRVFPIMRAQEGGAIVNVSSVTAYGNIGQANYSVSKAGLVGLTKTL